ncbi:MAG: hypothetical protein WAK17_22795 [Candidatus Nitrosopolaris sp.]
MFVFRMFVVGKAPNPHAASIVSSLEDLRLAVMVAAFVRIPFMVMMAKVVLL